MVPLQGYTLTLASDYIRVEGGKVVSEDTKNGNLTDRQDVVYTFKLGQENGVSGVDFAYYDVDNFEIIDDFTIDIKTFEPFANAFIYLAQTTFYMHQK